MTYKEAWDRLYADLENNIAATKQAKQELKPVSYRRGLFGGKKQDIDYLELGKCFAANGILEAYSDLFDFMTEANKVISDQ